MEEIEDLFEIIKKYIKIFIFNIISDKKIKEIIMKFKKC